ncbi:hypothetical protein [Azospirillum palustre]
MKILDKRSYKIFLSSDRDDVIYKIDNVEIGRGRKFFFTPENTSSFQIVAIAARCTDPVKNRHHQTVAMPLVSDQEYRFVFPETKCRNEEKSRNSY